MGKIYSILSYVLWPPMTEIDYLFKAVKDNDFYKLEDMVRAGADTSKNNDEGFTLLHLASELGHDLCVQVLLFYNCIDVNARCASETPMGPLMTTPLHLAAAEGWNQVIGCLVEYGADINAVTITGWTPLHYLIITENMTSAKLEALSILIRLGADVNIRDSEGNHMLDIAVLYGHFDVTRVLLNSSVNVDTIASVDPNLLKNDKVFHCVQLCVNAGAYKAIEKYDVIKYLIEGSNPDDPEKETLLDKINSFLSIKSEVQSLKHLCRISIRKMYPGCNLNLVVERLAIPHSLRVYLLLFDLEVCYSG